LFWRALWIGSRDKTFPNMASRSLSLCLHRLSADWQARRPSGCAVEKRSSIRSSSCGTVYTASSWQELRPNRRFGRVRAISIVEHNKPKRYSPANFAKTPPQLAKPTNSSDFSHGESQDSSPVHAKRRRDSFLIEYLKSRPSIAGDWHLSAGDFGGHFFLACWPTCASSRGQKGFSQVRQRQ